MTPAETVTLVAYFFVLIILAVYGWHRYYLVYLYMRNRDKEPRPGPALSPTPIVTIQLPLYNEMYVADRLIEAVCHIDYPRERLEIQVLDDSTDETRAIAELAVRRYAEEGFDIRYFHRTDRTGYKAGALEAGLNAARGEFIAIFDADFLPPSQFLNQLMPHFADAQVGMVQARWGHINQDYSLLTKIQSILLDGHFVLEHGGRNRSGRFFNFNGTAGIWRRTAIADAGGWQHDTLTEDLDLSYRAQLEGWKFVYAPAVECPSELPVETYGFQVQQSRWAKGLTQVAMKLLPSILRSKLPWRVKAEAFFHLTPNIGYPLMIVVSLLMLPVMIVRFYMGWFEMLLIDLPLIAASFWSISAFSVVAQRELFPRSWKRSILFLPALMAAGVALTIINTKAVFEALIGYQTAFARTAKYGAQKTTLANLQYRRRSGWLPYAELAAGSGFLTIVLYAIQSYNYLAIPFLLLFVGGYFWAGVSTLWEEYQGKLAFERQRELASQAQAAKA